MGAGFRASALANLTPADFDMTAAVRTVTLATRFNMPKKPMVPPLPPDVAAELTRLLADKPAGVPVWGGTWATGKKAAEMLRGELREVPPSSAVGSPYSLPFGSGMP